MKPLRIITPDFQLLAEIDHYSSMFLIRRWHGIGEIELRINRYLKDVDKLIKGNLIIPGADLHKAFIIKHREIELDENGKATENWLIKGLSLKSITGQRITIPPVTTAYDNKQGNAETVMQHYIRNNAVDPSDVNRKIENLLLSGNQNRGSTVSWQSRYKNLAEELMDISVISGLGWNVRIDTKQKTWVFEVLEGRDLTADQSILPPVIFSPQFDSLKTLHFTESDLNYKNAAYVAGPGEGTQRIVSELGNDSGLNRHEVFIDARDISDETEGDNPKPRPLQDILNDLTDRGNQKIQEMIQEKYLEGQVLTKSPFIYERDYDLGDTVTIQNKDWGVTMNARITEVKEIYEQSGFKIEAIFGNNRPTIIKKIKQELAQISEEVRR
jgi:Siphovirus ReqiPepy6 Gp37-like protein